jgi:hypothetical protein
MNGTVHGPVPFANDFPTYIYFVSFVILGAIFMIGVFSGILYINFKLHKSKYTNPDLK